MKETVEIMDVAVPLDKNVRPVTISIKIIEYKDLARKLRIFGKLKRLILAHIRPLVISTTGHILRKL